MTTYLDKHVVAPSDVPQSQPLDSTQVENSAGGFVYTLDPFARDRKSVV